MSWRDVIPAPVRATMRRLIVPSAPRPVDPGVWVEASQIDELRRLYFEASPALGGAWEPWRDAHLVLPEWFVHGLDPWSDAYAAQQERLWALIAGAEPPYRPQLHEKETGWDDVDPVRAPGYYKRRDAQAVVAASDHVIATGMILKHSGLAPGDRALEYGAGFGQTALALARLGVHVDTVDISETFCDFVRQQGEHFGVPLKAFHGEFGLNPRPGTAYDLILFYESFHHCVDFRRVVPAIERHLAPGGRIVLAGEPVFRSEYPGIPYPWGVRLHSEVAAVMRKTQWFELGFTERFLYELFERAGLAGRRIDCEASPLGSLYLFERPGDVRAARVTADAPTATMEKTSAVCMSGSVRQGEGDVHVRATTAPAPVVTLGNRPNGRPRVFVIGNSHTQALSLALQEASFPGVAFEVRWLLGKNGEMPLADACAMAASLEPDDLFVMALLGGYHMRVGLLQHEEPFWLASERADAETDVPGGHTQVPRAAMAAHLRAATLEYRQLDKLLVGCRARRYHLMTPPPTPDNAFIARRIPLYQGQQVTADRIAAPELRRRLWSVERDMLSQLLLEKNVRLLDPPADVLDAHGFVDVPFRGSDGVHANVAYGRAVLQQLASLALGTDPQRSARGHQESGS